MILDLSLGKKDYFSYYEKNGIKAISLPYGNYHKPKEVYTPYEMTFVLSDQTIDNDILNDIFHNSTMENVFIQLPKLKIENTLDIKTMLQNMGVSDLFLAGQANLSPMLLLERYFVSDITQKAAIRIDEKGTQASSASYVEVMRGSPGEKEFIANKPFSYFLRNKETGQILFEGKFVNAAEK